MLRLLPLPLVLLALASACGGSAAGQQPGDLEGPPPDLYASLPQGLVTCNERQDTGYTSGNAFSITVVTCDSKPCERDTANAYAVMQAAAAADGVNLVVVSGFRTQSEQQYLYGCYVNCNCNNCNLAAQPGYSNHQSGHALDLNTSSPGVLSWLNTHGGTFGFSRTVPSEPWHWEWWGGGPGGGPCGLTQAGCTTGEADNCAAFGCGCVDHACNGGFCPGPGCTAQETSDCGNFGCGCVDGQCNGGFCPGTGCTARETNDCTALGCGCADHACAGGACPGTGCTPGQTATCTDGGLACSLGTCRAPPEELPPDAGQPTPQPPDAGEPPDAGAPSETPPSTPGPSGPAAAEAAIGTLGCTALPGAPVGLLALLALTLLRRGRVRPAQRPHGT
ncbi:MAG: M15 family metallopeptidase [Deltaproteobacteria bacterium]|nr:M15 family metallopeptidase [Deltaproteobacteria bacterium]